MNATPTKRRVVLGALDVNNAMNTTSPVRSLALTPSKKRDRDALKKPTTPHSLKATASPTTSRVSSLDTTPKKRAREVEQQLQLREGAKEGPTRQKQQVAGQPSPKRLCLVPSTSTTAASHAAASATAATAENEKSQSLDIDTNDDEGNVPSSVSVEQAPAQAPQQAPQQAQASPEQDREHDREEQEQDRDREQDRDQDQDQDSNSPGADSSIFDNSAHDISQSTVVTEPDVTPPPPPPAPAPAPAPAGIVVAPLATLPLPTLPPPAPSQRPAMTREEARQKAEILRLRLGLASYKVRTGQTEVPLERLQQTSAPPPQRKALPSAPVPSLQAARGASFSHAPRDVNAKTKELPAAARDLLSLSRA
ncbi:hypothetical protein SLS62_006705 [Diatrype stigma]|uniref:Cyclin-dependent kinase protein n=1 Tax=Diatrype stigma TaxID=117547 RepID=A0AAN9UM78_9PEZI